MALGEGKVAYGIEGLEYNESMEKVVRAVQRRRTSGDEVYDRVLELARRHIGWILLVVAVVIITVIVQAASSGGQEKLLDPHSKDGHGSGYLLASSNSSIANGAI